MLAASLSICCQGQRSFEEGVVQADDKKAASATSEYPPGNGLLCGPQRGEIMQHLHVCATDET